MNDDRPEVAPWVCAGDTAEHEDQLIGNREGFCVLRKKIDEALETGLVRVEEGGIEWVDLKIVADDPRKKKPVSQGRDALNLAVVASVVAFLLFVFVAGIMNIHSWFISNGR